MELPDFIYFYFRIFSSNPILKFAHFFLSPCWFVFDCAGSGTNQAQHYDY